MAASRNSRSPDLTARLGAYLVAAAPTGTLCVAFSGGRDSAALLHAASRLALGERLRALHVHHGISPHADAWAEHCAAFCAERQVRLDIVRVEVERDSPLGLEAAARIARYEAFAACGSEAMLLAHHRDDQAETVLFNLLRGAGVAGAAGMPGERCWRGFRLLRPWLDVAAAEIAAYAAVVGLHWIDDESNTDPAFSRNFLRHRALPLLRERFPAASAALAAAAAHFAEADALLAETAAEDWRRCADGEALRLPDLRHMSPARLKNLLRWRLRKLGWRAPAAVRLDEFVRQLRECGPEGRPRLDLPDGCLCLKRRRLCWLRR